MIFVDIILQRSGCQVPNCQAPAVRLWVSATKL